ATHQNNEDKINFSRSDLSVEPGIVTRSRSCSSNLSILRIVRVISMRPWDGCGCARFAGRQIRRFPIHRHPNPGTAAWMVEEDEFLERRRIEFAISAQLQRDFGHAIRFSSGVDSKSVGFPL